MKAFLTGLGIGAMIGLAVAPKSGEETRRDILENARERFESALDRFEDAKQRVGDMRDNISEGADRVMRKAQRQYESVAKAGLLEILNDWPEDRLIEINGIGPVLASKIIQNRPYKQESDLLEAKILPPSAIEAIRKAS